MLDNKLLNAICTANDQGHRAAHHRAEHPLENCYDPKDYDGNTRAAWQIGYDKERARIAQDEISVSHAADRDTSNEGKSE